MDVIVQRLLHCNGVSDRGIFIKAPAAAGKFRTMQIFHRLVLQSVSQSLSQSLSQSVSQSVSQSLSQSVSQSVTQSVSQSVTKLFTICGTQKFITVFK